MWRTNKLVTALGWHGPVSARAGVTSGGRPCQATYRRPILSRGQFTALACPRLLATSPATQTPTLPTTHPHLDVPERDHSVGEIVRVRTRRWLVEEVTPIATSGESSRVRLACADDDAQGQELGVFWKCELDRAIPSDEP